MAAAPRVAVVGHVEWVIFASGAVPLVGEISLLHDPFEQPAGGGGVSTWGLARLGAAVTFFTALGNDAHGDAAERFFTEAGVEVRARRRDAPQNRVLTILDDQHERTIMVMGKNAHPVLEDDLGWADLAGFDAIYFTGEDPRTLAACRAGRDVVITARRLAALRGSGVVVDMVIGSATDSGEQLEPGDRALARVVVETHGAEGGRWRSADAEGAWRTAPLPGPAKDSYGAGDSFLAGTTFGLAAGRSVQEALELGARCGAEAVTRRGAYGEDVNAAPVHDSTPS